MGALGLTGSGRTSAFGATAKGTGQNLGLSFLTGYQGGLFKQGSLGRKAFDPLGFFNTPDKPPTPAPPPAPPDETASILREISRSQTDQALRRSQGRAGSFLNGGYEAYRAPGSRNVTGG